MSKNYETVIGLEVHVELATKTKIFCGCSTAFGGAPNTHTCPVCTGMPGSLPVLNKQVVEYAMAVGLATNCDITQNCKFDRKNYFYPDNPQNYQISQLYLPICRNGKVEIDVDGEKKDIRIHEIHMEEDAGKLVHDPWTGDSLVDFNRSGVPLIEIVSEPDMRSADEVIAYLEKLRLIIQYLGASDCKLQEGSMRADVNLSVREVGAEEFGTRTEMKNLNSFKAIKRAIEGEMERQIDLIEAGEKVVQETRRWDDTKGASYAMRSKEDAQDYRYFPDPDLVPIEISDEWMDKVRDAQPEFRDEKKVRYKEEYDLAARIHMGSPKRYLYEVAETIKDGTGFPKLINDDEVVPILLSKGASLKEAYDYSVSGCAECRMPNRDTYTSPNAYINFAAALEMVLYNGKMKKYGDEIVGLETGNFEDFESFDEVLEAYLKQQKNLIRHAFIQQHEIIRQRQQRMKNQQQQVKNKGKAGAGDISCKERS